MCSSAITNSFNHLGYIFNSGREKEAIKTLIKASECYEVGLGDSRKRVGKPFGDKLATNILSLYKDIPQINKSGFIHFEEIQLFVDNVSKDRVSDIACSFMKSFLIDYTIQESNKYGIPLIKSNNIAVYNYKTNSFDYEEVELPQNPENNVPIILVPRRWLRYIPWINSDDYFKKYFPEKNKISDTIELLAYNRKNYDVVQGYIKIKEREQKDCKNDPLFEPIPVISAYRKFSVIKSLPMGKTENADKEYEDNACQLMASLVYPQLDFAKIQSRTESGILIRDLIFYNNRSYDFLKDIYDQYECKQIVIELKNVKALDGEHLNQLNRYLNEQFGRFGIILTRSVPAKNIFKNTVDLWSGQRKCILILSDDDLKLMCQLFKSKQRLPIDVIKKKFVEFIRACPG